MINVTSTIDIGIHTVDDAQKALVAFKGYLEDSTKGFLFVLNNLTDTQNFSPNTISIGYYLLERHAITTSSSSQASSSSAQITGSGSASPTKVYGKQVKQTVTFNDITSPSAYNSNSKMKEAYAKGYGTAIGIFVIPTSGPAYYKPNCVVGTTASRRAAAVEFTATVAASAGVSDTALAAATDPAALGTALVAGIQSVTQNDQSLASVAVPSASSMSVSAATITTTGTAPPTPPSSSSSGLGGGAIAGIVIGCIVLLALIGVGVYCLVGKSSKKNNDVVKGQVEVGIGGETAVKERV